MKRLFFLLVTIFGTCGVFAQSMSFDKFKQQQNSKFNQFKTDKQAEFDAFRKRVNDQYAAFMEQSWEQMQSKPAVTPKKEPEVKPVVYQEPTPAPVPAPQPAPTPAPQPQPTPKPTPAPTPQPAPQPAPAPTPTPKPAPAPQPTPQVLPIQQEIVEVPKPTPAPEPIAPVQPKEDPYKAVSVSFYGTTVSVGFPEPDNFKLAGLNEKQLANAWKQLATDKYDITIANALEARKKLKLCDWGYLQMLQAITKKHYGNTNEAVFMQVFLMTQSGYRVRMANGNGKLYMLISSQYSICDMPYYTIDNQKFYAIDFAGGSLQICKAAYDKEKSLSLQIAQTQNLTQQATQKRILTSKKGVTAGVCVNKNLIDFYNNYPCGYLNNDLSTRWAAYANTPLEQSVKDMLYPTLKKTIQNMTQKDAVGIILNWVQTAFEYEYDDNVWGGDRAFFATETLYYPYCDCEDRSILFSRLVRDLIGLPVALLYYPGHLATAVAFQDEVRGDYVLIRDKKYTICDPTYIGANVGMTMPGMNNQKAKAIVLK
ncbi:MAG: hypothetical protein KBT27_11535 [Prevotellaceae bacterium]|nr:hypothetical protein [Candidatus Faecinaster equi]